MNDDTNTDDQQLPEQQVQLTEQLPQTTNFTDLQAAFERAVSSQMASLPQQEADFRRAEAARHPDWGDPDADEEKPLS